MDNLGLLYALGAAIAWGSYAVPFKISKSENLGLFQAWMAVGILISGFIFSVILGYSLSFNIYGLFSGFLWATANFISLTALVNLGIAKTAPILACFIILSTFLWGSLVFNELPEGFMTASIGILAIIAGVAIVSAVNNSQSLNTKRGVMAAILAGLIFGSQLVPLKLGNVLPSDFFFSSTLGIFMTALAIMLFKRVRFKQDALKMSLLSGIIWNMGNLLSIVAISLIGLAKSIPLTQSAVLIAVVWGVFYFKEVTAKDKIVQILIGAVVLLTGVVILGLA